MRAFHPAASRIRFWLVQVLTNRAPSDPDPMLGEPLVPPSRNHWLSDTMDVDGAVGRSLSWSRTASRSKGTSCSTSWTCCCEPRLAARLSILASTLEIKFTEHHDYQSGFPGQSASPIGSRTTAVGVLRRTRAHSRSRAQSSLGWGGGIGIRFNFGPIASYGSTLAMLDSQALSRQRWHRVVA